MTVHMPDLSKPPLAADRAFGEIDPNDVQTAPLRRGLALWQDLRGARLFPARARMSPRALGTLLRHTILIKVLDNGAEFQIRIIGDAIMAVHSDPIQGLTMAEINTMLPGYGDMLHQLYSKCCEIKRPLAFRGEFRREPDQRVFHREHLLVPLGEADEAVDYLISFLVYSQPQS